MTKLNFLTMLAAMLAFTVSGQAQTTLGSWNFENTTLSATPSLTSGYIPADEGLGQAIGVHALSSTFATPTGNGSAKAFNSLHWSVGDYYQFEVPTTGYDHILVTFNQISGTLGPAHFKLATSNDGVNFTDFTSYTVLKNASPNTWSSSIAVISTSYSKDLSTASSVSNAPTAYFRLIDTDTVAAGGGTVAASGGSRIDNFSISGDPIAVPESTAVGWLAFALALAVIGARRFLKKPV